MTAPGFFTCALSPLQHPTPNHFFI